MKLGLRIAFTSIFFLILFSTALTTTERKDKISYDECLRDEAF
jgi:hypothetical protein